MSDLAFIRDRIGERSLAELQALAKRSGVPYPTVLKVARGYTRNPLADTVDRLARAVRRERRKRAAS